MPNETPATPVSETTSENFLKTSSASESTNPYGDFFQETSDGNISIWSRAQKSGLEVTTDILWYIVPVVIIVAILSSIHVFIRTQEDNGFAESYNFICPYLHMGIERPEGDCKTLTMIEQEYTEKLQELNSEIISWLSEYIPIKISKNIIDASPEKAFILKAFANKVRVDDIMKQFERIRSNSSYGNSQNIECNGISITNWDTLSTQCTIYGWAIWTDDSSNKFWSARIEALSFLDEISNTSKSQFILLNPPSSLNVEILAPGESEKSVLFKTRTTVQIQVRYIPFNKKN